MGRRAHAVAVVLMVLTVAASATGTALWLQKVFPPPPAPVDRPFVLPPPEPDPPTYDTIDAQGRKWVILGASLPPPESPPKAPDGRWHYSGRVAYEAPYKAGNPHPSANPPTLHPSR